MNCFHSSEYSAYIRSYISANHDAKIEILTNFKRENNIFFSYL